VLKPTIQADVNKDLAQYVAKATTLLHAPETRDAVISMLDNNDQVQKIANVTVFVMQKVDAAARTKGLEIQDSVRVFAAGDIVTQIAEIGNAAKKFSIDKDLVQLALSVAVQDYVNAEVKAGRIDRKKLQVAIEADLRKMPPQKRKEIQQQIQQTQEIARRYNQGKGQNPGVV